MEKPVNNTTSGIFDMETSPDYSRETLISTEEISNLPEIAIVNDERIGWEFFKDSDDERMKATVSFAENWARYMQSRSPEGNNLEAIWVECANAIDSEYVTSYMKYFAVRILSRYWVHGEALRKVFDDYWKEEGQTSIDAQNELLEAHLG